MVGLQVAHFFVAALAHFLLAISITQCPSKIKLQNI
jgi:hypothetical protein